MVNRSQNVRSGPLFFEPSAVRRNGRIRHHRKELKPSSSASPTPPATPSRRDPTNLKSKNRSPTKSDLEEIPEDIEENPFVGGEFEAWVDEADDILDNKHKTQHDFVLEWIPYARNHLKTIIGRGKLANGGQCSFCASESGLWTCMDCQGLPAFCRECCRKQHAFVPYHRIKYWKGTYYARDWLYNLGVVIPLGHHGAPCPSYKVELQSEPTYPKKAPHKVDIYSSPSQSRDRPSGAPAFTIGHTNGIHKIWIAYCCCEGSPPNDEQLLASGLFPLSFQNCRSAFTFSLLDDFRQDNLICKVSSYYYYKKLRRLTHPWFFHLVLDRYKELRRASKIWRYLEHLKHAGLLYNADGGLSPAALALFCAACPQVGVNIPANWRKDPDQLPYIRSFVMDGNFSASHQRQKDESDEPWLSDGALFLARRAEFDEYITVATEEKENPTCHKFHAVNDRLTTHKGRDITGIGSTACARHGAFCPGGTVNFQRGERQVHMDYSACSAIQYTNVGDIPRIIMLYDINCQYNVNFARRIARNPGVTFPMEKTVYWGIGEFHVTAHVPHCFARYSPQFIPGAGSVDGEILETLWSLLKDIFPSTQSATLASRAETLDDHMQESNWKKLTGIVLTIIKKYQNSQKEAKDANGWFDKLSRRVRQKSPGLLNQWENVAKVADVERLSDHAAMDIYDTKFEAKPSRTQRQNQERQKEIKTGEHMGATAWLAEGIKLQELQHSIRVLTKRSSPTESTMTEIARKRETLQTRLAKFHETAESFFPPAHDSSTDVTLAVSNRDYLKDDFVDSDEEPIFIPTRKELQKRKREPKLDSPRKRRKPNRSADPTLPENVDLLLPSTLGLGLCKDLKILPLAAKEHNLREGQANDAISGLQLSIGERSFIFRNKIRPINSKKQVSRSWDAVNAGAKKIRHNQWVYTKAREAMIALGASSETLAEYKELQDKDLRTITTVVIPQAPGQKRKKLSWIWTFGSNSRDELTGDEGTPEPDSESADENPVIELIRLNWLRARARRNRLQEEINQTKHEMVWTVRFFLHRYRTWHTIATSSSPDVQAYAFAQSAMWYDFAAAADSAYKSVCASFPQTFGYQEVVPAGNVDISETNPSDVVLVPVQSPPISDRSDEADWSDEDESDEDEE